MGRDKPNKNKRREAKEVSSTTRNDLAVKKKEEIFLQRKKELHDIVEKHRMMEQGLFKVTFEEMPKDMEQAINENGEQDQNHCHRFMAGMAQNEYGSKFPEKTDKFEAYVHLKVRMQSLAIDKNVEPKLKEDEEEEESKREEEKPMTRDVGTQKSYWTWRQRYWMPFLN